MTFDPEAFLLKHRHLPLVLIRQQLHQHLSQYKNALVELINEDYADFVHLSSSLKTIAPLLQDLDVSVMDILQSADSHFKEQAQEWDRILTQRSLLRQKQQYLQRLVKMNDAVDRMESMTAEDDLKTLERVAVELNQLQFLLEQDDRNLPHASMMRARVDRISSLLEESLAIKLQTNLVKSQSSTDVSHLNALVACFRVYVALNKVSVVEEVVAETLVRPRLNQLIQNEHVTNAERLSSMLDQILDFVKQELLGFIDGCRYAMPMFKFIVQSVWIEIVTKLLSTDMQGLYAAGIPSQFHKNYLLIRRFVKRFFTECVPSKEDRQAILVHPLHQEFINRWPLSVYFQLRFREVAEKFDAATDKFWDVDQALGALSEGDLLTPSSVSLIESLEVIWSDDVYLSPLAARFWRFTLQLLGRYMHLFQQQLSSIVGTISASPVESATSPAMKRASSQDLLNASATFLQESRRMVVLWIDLQRTQQQTMLLFQDRILRSLNHPADAAVVEEESKESIVDSDLLRKAFEQAWDVVQTTLAPDFSRLLCQKLSQPGIDLLRHLKAIPAQYRRTNRDPPTSASLFIQQLFEPVATFLNTFDPFLNKSMLQQIVVGVGEEVTLSFVSCSGLHESCMVLYRYFQKSQDMLLHLKQLEDSLKRLQQQKKKKSSEEAEDMKMSDEDKIRLQMYLDIQQYAQELKAIGVDGSTLPSHAKLLALVEEYQPLATSAKLSFK